MSSFSSFQALSKEAVGTVLRQAPQEVPKLQAAYDRHFPNEALSATRQRFVGSTGTGRNAALEEALAGTMDAVDLTLTTLNSVERFIHLTIPKMEDGNNFGVTVQLQALKHLGDAQEKLQKQLEELAKYAGARADAVEKCKLPSVATSKTTTQSSSSSAGTDKEKGETSSKSQSESVEQKQVESTSSGADLPLRQEAVAAVDLLYYSKAKQSFAFTLTSLLSVLDFVEKNKEKIEAPKGSQGTSSAYHSMY